jgi:hypothetical protein
MLNDNCKEDNNYDNLYRFITRNRQHRVGVDAYIVRGDNNETYLTDHNLNVSHRTTYEDLEKHKIQG